MILVDTSVWIDHFRCCNRCLAGLLEQGAVICHPFVAGELACGNLRQRREILSLLAELPGAEMAAHEEVLALIENEELAGKGLGWVDVHLLASARLMAVPLWTKDKALAAAAATLGVGWRP